MSLSKLSAKKAALAFLCSMAMVIALVPTAAFAEGLTPSGLAGSCVAAGSTATVGGSAKVDIVLEGNAGTAIPECAQIDVNATNAAIEDVTAGAHSANFDYAISDDKSSITVTYYGKETGPTTLDSTGQFVVASITIRPKAVGTARVAVNASTSVVGKTGNLKEMSITAGADATITVNQERIKRLAGNIAEETATVISSEGFSSSSVVVIARADDFADALGATGLAGTLECPILLTDRNSLTPATADEITRLGATTAYVIGGTGAIDGQVDDDLNAIGVNTDGDSRRIFGNDAWDTSLECAKEIEKLGGNPNSEVIIAMSSNFQDALSISTYAYYYKVPLLLENQDFGATGQLTSDEIAFVKTTTGPIYVPGGPGAVSTATVEDIFTERDIIRRYGNNGYDTSNVIATEMLRDGMLSPDYVGIACGAMDPKGVDALAGAALIGSKGGIMLLDNPKSDLDDGVNYTTIKDAVDSKGYPSFLQAISDSVGMAYILGGNYVAPQSFYDMVKNVLGA